MTRSATQDPTGVGEKRGRWRASDGWGTKKREISSPGQIQGKKTSYSSISQQARVGCIELDERFVWIVCNVRVGTREQRVQGRIAMTADIYSIWADRRARKAGGGPREDGGCDHPAH